VVNEAAAEANAAKVVVDKGIEDKETADKVVKTNRVPNPRS
jgi:hypothetical protein